MKRTDLVAFVAGVVFAVGLGISGMTQPSKIIHFLDFTGGWDPSLAFVMVGAIGVHVMFARRAKRTTAPWFAPSFALPLATGLDRRLLLGAAMFGVGWGTAGYCPGPAIVSVVTLDPTALSFVAAMLAGMVIHWLALERRPRPLSEAVHARIDVPAP
jgi:uncharacterized membrane protein YedE/YeeE